MTLTRQKTSNISIIIPTLNEEANITGLAANLSNTECQRIIVDGGSSDATVAKAQEHGFAVLQGVSGRGAQLNFGAEKANGSILLFLHADTRLPHNFCQVITDAVEEDNFVIGAFRLGIDTPTPALNFIAACANLRSQLFGFPYGDQALFIKRESFTMLNGFANVPIMEDYMFVKNARKRGKVLLLPDKVTTSARRWQRLGVLQTTLINQLVLLGFFFKVSPKRLALLYRR